MDIFVRTGVWFVEIANNFGANKEYSVEEKEEFRKHPEKLVAHAKDIEDQVNGLWGTFYTGSAAQAEGQKMYVLYTSHDLNELTVLDSAHEWQSSSKTRGS